MSKAVKKRTSVSKAALGSDIKADIQVVREFWYSEETCKGAYLVEMENGERVSIKGDFHAPLIPNLDYEIQGVLGEFRGSRQIEVEKYRTLPPQGKQAMISLLKTLPGIHKKANTIYDLYGSDSLEVLKKDPERIIKEAKVLKKWAMKAQSYLLTELEGEEYITELMTYGLTIKDSKALYQKYREQVATIVKSNPYVLSRQVRGFGFLKCEKIALEIQFDPYSPHRIEAAIKHLLEEAQFSGHCFLLGDALVAETMKLLYRANAPIYATHIYPCIQSLLNQGELVVEKERVYLREIHEMEKYVCEKLVKLTGEELTRSRQVVEDALQTVLSKEPETQLEDKQREAIIQANLKRGGIFVLNGHAGTGKTFTLRLIMEVYHELKQREEAQFDVDQLLDCCESTEEVETLVAAIVEGYQEEIEALKIAGKTKEARGLERLYEQVEEPEDLLRFLQQILIVCEGTFIKAKLPNDNPITRLQAKLPLKKSTKKAKENKQRLAKTKKKAKPADVLYLAPTGKAAKVMSRATNQPASTIHKGLNYDPATHDFRHGEEDPLPQEVIVCDETSMLDLWLFSKLLAAIREGTKLIFLGDTNQLPSIGAGNVLKDLLESQVVDNVTLTIVKRQGSLSDILKNAKNILEGKLIENYEETHDAYFIAKNNPVDIQTRILDEMEKLLKQPEFTLDEVQVLSPMRKGPLGTNMLNYLIQQRFNPEPDGQAESAVTFEAPMGDSNEKITLYFKRGDRVINIRNNYEMVFCKKIKEGEYEADESLGVGITNGECGVIADIIYEDDEEKDEPVKVFVVQYEEGYAKYKVNELDNLLHAYCLTIHKSQGSGWKAILFPVHNSHFHMLENNLIYTAWTRSRIFAMAIGNEYTLKQAIQTYKATTRNTTLSPRLKYVKSQQGSSD